MTRFFTEILYIWRNFYVEIIFILLFRTANKYLPTNDVKSINSTRLYDNIIFIERLKC